MRECRWHCCPTSTTCCHSYINTRVGVTSVMQRLKILQWDVIHKKIRKIGGRRLNDETKWRAIFLKKEGKLSNRQIAACCKVSPSTVTNLWEKYNETGSMNERNDRRTGASRKPPQGKTEHLCVQVSVTELKQLPCTDAT